MNKKIIAALLSAIISAICVPAVTAAPAPDIIENLKKKIAGLKKNPDSCIYAEVTAATAEEARQLAEEILWQEVNKWVATQPNLNASSTLLVKKVESEMEEIALTRGNMFRCFLYINKKDITDGDSSVLLANPSHKSEEKAEQTLPAATTPQKMPGVIAELLKITDYSHMAERVKELKAQGAIDSYGRYATLSKPELYYLIVYNRQGTVVAILSPGEHPVNMATGEIDAVTNYTGCGALGISLP